MALLAGADLIHLAQQAGYTEIAIEHPRHQRWLLTMRAADGATVLVVVQVRRLVSSADVLDLAELVRVRRVARSILWAYDGTFSTSAVRTCTELGARQLILTTALPPALTST